MGETVERFTREVVAPRIFTEDRDGRLSAEAWTGVAELGLLGALVSETNGGGGYGALTTAVLVEKLARVNASLAVSVASHNVAAAIVDRFGPPSVLEEHLGSLVSGTQSSAWVGIFGKVTPEAKTGLSFDGDIVQGTTTWVLGAGAAELFAICTGTGTVGLVGADGRGVERGPLIGGLGLRSAGMCQLSFRCAKSALLPEPAERTGEALFALLRAAIFVGLANGAFIRARDYARMRTQFAKPIASFQAIQWKLADMATTIDAAWLLVARAAEAFDVGETRDLAARAEAYAGRMAVQVTNDAVQIFGGNGFVREYAVERFFRDAQMLEVLGGSHEPVIATEVLGD